MVKGPRLAKKGIKKFPIIAVKGRFLTIYGFWDGGWGMKVKISPREIP